MKDPDKKAHAVLSASGSERWMNCPGSIRLSKGCPPKEDGPAAREGTDAHYCLEMILKAHGRRPYSVANMLKGKYSTVMVDHALWAYHKIIGYLPGPESLLLCEIEARLDFIKSGMFGTLDAAIVEPFGTLHIIDFKYGKHVVEVRENTQLMYYALGIMNDHGYNFAKVKHTILQPRALHKNGFERHWEVPAEYIESWQDDLKRAAMITDSPRAPLKAGKWCFWCPANVNNVCPEVAGAMEDQAQDDFNDL